MPDPLEVLIVAGEASGDVHAGALMKELRWRLPQARFFGMGGPRMREAGLDALYDAREISVLGFAEVVPKLVGIFRVLRGLARAAKERRPDLAILVDVPDFNLRLAKRLKKLAVPVVYYISPMVWASRPGRVKQIARDVDTMLCILPFEESYLRERGVEARYVGNPILDQIPHPASPAEFRKRLGIEADRSTLAILPGSRPSELSRLMPTLVKAAEKLAESHPSLQVVVPVAPTLDRARVASYFEGRKVNAVLIDGRAAEVVGASDAAIVCSGTATLEAGLMLRPFAVVYKVSPLSEIIYRLLVRVAHYSLINLLAGEPLVPELIQRQCSADRIAREIGEFFEDGAARDRMIRGLARIRDSLGAPGASARAAEAVVSLVDRMARRPPGARTVRAETTSGI